MSGFVSLSQIANSAANKSKSQQRIIEREIKTDGFETPLKKKLLEKAKAQEEIASNYFSQGLNQDSENAKAFMDSVKETLDKINEEAKKREEEKVAENDKDVSQNNAGENSQHSEGNGEPGTIVDVVIPSTVVSSDLSTSENGKDEQTVASVNVSA